MGHGPILATGDHATQFNVCSAQSYQFSFAKGRSFLLFTTDAGTFALPGDASETINKNVMIVRKTHTPRSK